MGTNEEFAAMLKFVSKHKIVPVLDEVYVFEDAYSGMHKLHQSSQFGKLVISIPGA